MKKAISIFLVISMVFVLVACGNEPEIAQAPNPITVCQSVDELTQATGITMSAPEGATKIIYSYVDPGVEGESLEAQVEFILDDTQYYYRAKKTDATTLSSAVNTDPDADMKELAEMMDKTIEDCAMFAGLYDEWKASASVDVAQREGIVAFNEGKSGFISWLDVAPGIVYSLCMTSNSTQDKLMQMAEKLFIPMQGDAK